MKISILLPYKENFSPEYAGAVSIFINDTINESKYKKDIFVYGNTNKKLKFNNNNFDLVLSINTLHNLKLENLNQALKEIERVGKKKFICVESFRNEKEFFNLQCWALTAETLIDTKSWKWLFMNSGYTGDFEFIYFE